MGVEIVVIGIVNAVCAIIGGLWLKSYLPSYMSEKGKNLATKEDISAITGKIEAVRVEFGHTAKNKEVYAEEQRRALMDFYDVSYELMNILGLSGIEPEDFYKADDTPVKKYISRSEERFSLGTRIYCRLQLYVEESSEIHKSARDLWNAQQKGRIPFFTALENCIGTIAVFNSDSKSHEDELDAKRTLKESFNKIDPTMKEFKKEITSKLGDYAKAISDHLRDGTMLKPPILDGSAAK